MHNKAAEVKQLERRLEKAIADLNTGTFENERLREQIDQLRRERQILDSVFRQLEKGLSSNRKQMDRVMQSMNEEKLNVEEARQKTRALNKMLERERKRFQKDCEGLENAVVHQSNVQKEREKTTRASDAPPPSRALGQTQEPCERTGASARRHVKGRRAYMVADEEELFSEQLMHRRILKLSFLNTIQRRHIRQHQKNIEVFEQAFSTIKSSTGISDIEEIVKIFIGLEQHNFSLLTYFNQLNREIETIDIRNRELQTQLKNYQQNQSQTSDKKDAALSDLIARIGKTMSACSEKDTMVEDAATALTDCRPLLWSIVTFLKQEVPTLVATGYEGDFPPMKAKPPDAHEDGLNLFLMYIEESIFQFRVCLPHSGAFQPSLPQRPLGSRPQQARPPGSELPSAAHILGGGEDSDDDTENGVGDRPWTRAELRERAQAMIQRRRKKPGPQATRAFHEEQAARTEQQRRGGETVLSLGGGAGGGASASEEVEAPSKRVDAPPPPRDRAASSSLSSNARESKDDMTGAANAPQHNTVPPAPRPPATSEPSEDGAGDGRDAMWWRGQGKEKKK